MKTLRFVSTLTRLEAIMNFVFMMPFDKGYWEERTTDGKLRRVEIVKGGILY
jgi:hypothetical protein